MRHIIFEEGLDYPVAILSKASSFNKQQLISNYIDKISNDIKLSKIIAFNLKYNEVGKVPVKFIKEYLSELLPELKELGTKYLYVADSNYFKVLAGVTKAEPHVGYAMPCKIKGYEDMVIILGVNYQALIYNPELQSKLNRTLTVLVNTYHNSYVTPGNNIIHSAEYPKTVREISEALDKLHSYPSLTCDIEGFSLKFNEAGIGTIAFAWDKHNGISFPVDYFELPEKDEEGNYGKYVNNQCIKILLRAFFETYMGEITYHSANYDCKIILYNLWMKDLLDTEGLLKGLEIITRGMHDIKIIAYLATNSTAGNNLGLKHLAQEFAGNWAKDDIKDIRKIPLQELLQYNLIDTLSTHYVREKYEPIMIRDNQQELYKGLMLDTVKLLIQVELTGMPMSRTKIVNLKSELQEKQLIELNSIFNNIKVQEFQLIIRKQAMEKANAKLKVKQHPLSKFDDLIFNPNSNPQLQGLLYETLGLPVIDFTDTKQPATGGDTVEKLINHTNDPDIKNLLSSLISYTKVTKILSTFIPAFEEAISKDSSDTVWLHGSFNIGGTLSGRLSSSDP